MKSDGPWLAMDGNFDQVRPMGPFARFCAYQSAALELAAGPVLVVVRALAGDLSWQGVLDGLVVTLVVGGIGLATWIYTSRTKRRADRLSRNGRAATARVVGATSVSIGEETGTAVTLRISGLGVPEFETTHRSIRHVPAVGEQVPVVVDPADNVFMVVR